MQVSVESGNGLERRMKVDLPPDRIEAELDKRLRELGRTARLPGFRPGKVPVKVLRRQYGERVRNEVFGDLVTSTFPLALGQEQLRPAGTPTFEPDIDQGQQRYGYTALFEVLPQFELGPLEGKTIKRPLVEITGADLEAMLQRLREQRKTWRAVDRPAQDDDKLTVSFTGTVDGEAFDGGSHRNLDLELGSGQMMPGFESGLVGARTGEQRVLDLRFADDRRAGQLKGKPVSFDVRVEAVAEPVLPEDDAELARTLGIADGNVEHLRADVRANMQRELKQRIAARLKQQAIDLLLEANRIELPQVLIKEEIRILKEQTLQNAGGRRLDVPDSIFEHSARRRVALGLIMAEVVKANGLEVDAERVRAAVEDMAAAFDDPQEVIDFYYSSKEHLASVEALALEQRVVDWVMERVTVEDEPATFQQMTAAAVHAGRRLPDVPQGQE